MSLIFMFVFCYTIVSIRLVDGLDGDYIERKQTQTINGFFILLVFFRHFQQYVELNSAWDHFFCVVNGKLGQLIVTTFLFYSGYGIMKSIQIKGYSYIDSIIKKRIPQTLLLFDSAILLYIVLNYILGISMTTKQIILSFIGWKGVGNSNWYIFTIMVMYLISYITFKIFFSFEYKTAKEKYFIALISATLITTFFIVIVSRFKEPWYYNTAFCYMAGMWYAYYKDSFEVFMKNKITYCIIFIILMGIFFVSYKMPYRDYFQIWYVSFVLMIIILTMKLKIKSSILKWCGENLFGLYILQRLPMIVLGEIEQIQNNIYVYFGLSFLITVILTMIFQRFVIQKIQLLFNE